MGLIITTWQMKNVLDLLGTQIIAKMPTKLFLALSIGEDFNEKEVHSLDLYNEITENGGIMSCPNLVFDLDTGTVTHHDGRHRAVALQQANIDTMQVMIRLNTMKDDADMLSSSYMPKQIKSQFNGTTVDLDSIEIVTDCLASTQDFITYQVSTSAAKQNPDTYKWYKLVKGRGVKLRSARGKDRVLELGERYGVKDMRGGKHVILFENELSNLYPITPQLKASLEKRSAPTRKVATRENRNETNTNLEVWDAELPKVRGRIVGELKTGVNSKNYQWRKLAEDFRVESSKVGKILETLSKGSIIGFRFISDRDGGVIISSEGLREVIPAAKFKKLVKSSKLIQINRWPKFKLSGKQLDKYKRDRDDARRTEHFRVKEERAQIRRVQAEERREARRKEAEKQAEERKSQERKAKAAQLEKELKAEKLEKERKENESELAFKNASIVGDRDTTNTLKAQIEIDDDVVENWVDTTSFEPSSNLLQDIEGELEDFEIDDMFTDLSKVKPLAEDDEDEKPKKAKKPAKSKKQKVEAAKKDSDDESDSDEDEETDEDPIDLDSDLDDSMDELKAIDSQLDELGEAKTNGASAELPDEGDVLEIKNTRYAVLNVVEKGRLTIIDLYDLEDEDVEEIKQIKLKPSAIKSFVSETKKLDTIDSTELDAYKMLAEDMPISKEPL